jgi:maltodextrin utilization protein YvdJ
MSSNRTESIISKYEALILLHAGVATMSFIYMIITLVKYDSVLFIVANSYLAIALIVWIFKARAKKAEDIDKNKVGDDG